MQVNHRERSPGLALGLCCGCEFRRDHLVVTLTTEERFCRLALIASIRAMAELSPRVTQSLIVGTGGLVGGVLGGVAFGQPLAVALGVGVFLSVLMAVLFYSLDIHEE